MFGILGLRTFVVSLIIVALGVKIVIFLVPDVLLFVEDVKIV